MRASVCFLIVLISAIAYSCTTSVARVPGQQPDSSDIRMIHQPQFGDILARADVAGTILLYQPDSQVMYSNDFEWANTGFLPASTFKITNSLIALETGVVEDAASMFYWDGEPRRMESWEADLSLQEAFRRSCVPCYQEVARNIGVDLMREYLDALDYGSMVVDSESIDLFWLEGESRISPVQQVDFLHRLVSREIPVSDHSFDTLLDIMRIEATGEYSLYGKTGWSIRDGHNNGWFVGFVEKGGEYWFFATNVDPKESFNMDLFPKIRGEITRQALADMGILPS